MVSWFIASLPSVWKGVHMENKPFETFEIRVWKETSLSVSILPICDQSQNICSRTHSQKAQEYAKYFVMIPCYFEEQHCDVKAELLSSLSTMWGQCTGALEMKLYIFLISVLGGSKLSAPCSVYFIPAKWTLKNMPWGIYVAVSNSQN